MSTRELIDAIAEGDSVKVDATFNSVMVDKVAAALDTMRGDLSQNMFTTATVEPTTEE
jgi:hypothetical protein